LGADAADEVAADRCERVGTVHVDAALLEVVDEVPLDDGGAGLENAGVGVHIGGADRDAVAVLAPQAGVGGVVVVDVGDVIAGDEGRTAIVDEDADSMEWPVPVMDEPSMVKPSIATLVAPWTMMMPCTSMRGFGDRMVTVAPEDGSRVRPFLLALMITCSW
jgi:hypothetical protein